MKIKKMIIVMIVLSFLPKAARPMDITAALKMSYFDPADDSVKNIYGSGMMYGGELDIGIGKDFHLWLEGSFFSKRGKLTFSEEETKLEIIPVGIGIKYMIVDWNLYLGIGLNYNIYREDNPIGNIRKGKVGYIGRLGGWIKIAGGLIMDFFTDYSYCKTQPADYEVNIGGLRVGIGLGYRF